ncbi:MAG: electron transfer flavoprotein subunit beta/FixA family protein [Chloroflexi bacterium]|nr:electron transfer flavoprotein subunit beta/FixA family protein [Chloroflexota bacterium]
MKIVVAVKQVPDSAAKVSVENGEVSWGDAPLVINPWDEFAVEAALLLTEEHGGDVVAVSLGDEDSKEALKHALAMGCSEAILISDPSLQNADTQAVAHALAAAIQKVGDVDMAVFGKQAIDGDNAVTPVQVARVLGWPALTLTSKISELDADAKTLKVERSIEEGRQIVEGKLPAVMSVVKDFGEPRYPSFMGIRKASKAEIPVWSAADLGADVPAAVVSWPEMSNPQAREVSNEIIEGGSPEEIAATLADKIIEEGVV